MRHAQTKDLYRHWLGLLPTTAKRGEGRAAYPSRKTIEPASMKHWLADIFILEDRDGIAFHRLAGTRVCALYGRELGGQPFADCFDGADIGVIRSWTADLAGEVEPLLIASSATTREGDTVLLETLLLPLDDETTRTTTARHASGARMLGITTPIEMPHWVGQRAIAAQQIRSVRVLKMHDRNCDTFGGGDRREMRPGRRVGHLYVLEGGIA